MLERIGTMRAGAKLPAVQAFCDELGMSQGTILRAIDELAEDGVVVRRPNRGAFVERPRIQANNILVVWPDLTEQVTEKPLSIHANTSRILNSVQESAAKLNKNLLITRRLAPDQPELDLGSNHVSGVLILFSYDRCAVETFVRRGVPVVLIDPLVRVSGVPFVMKDHCQNSREATRYLIARGHRSILHLTVDKHFEIPDLETPDGIADFVVEERIRGYDLGVREAGLRERNFVYKSQARNWSSTDKREILNVLQENKITACCCFNDDIAARLLHLCQESGIRVPQDLSIVGHDDAAIATVLQPALTTIQPPLDELGALAIQLLMQQIDSGKRIGNGMTLPSRLIERDSVCTLLPNGQPVVNDSPTAA